METGSGGGLSPAGSHHPRALLGSRAPFPSHSHPRQGRTSDKGEPQRRELGLPDPQEQCQVITIDGGLGVAKAQEAPMSPEEPLSLPELRHPQERDPVDRLDSKSVYLFLTLFIFVFLSFYLGEVMSLCNTESMERPLSHFSKRCFFQSRKQS